MTDTIFQSEGTSGDAQELDLANVGGVFFVLVVGSLLGLAVGICELLCQTLRRAARCRRPFSTQLSKEISFLTDFRSRTRQLTPPPSTPHPYGFVSAVTSSK